MIRRSRPHAPDFNLFGVSPAETGSQMTCYYLQVTYQLSFLLNNTTHLVGLLIPQIFGFPSIPPDDYITHFISRYTTGLLCTRTLERLNPFTCHCRARHQSGASFHNDTRSLGDRAPPTVDYNTRNTYPQHCGPYCCRLCLTHSYTTRKCS